MRGQAVERRLDQAGQPEIEAEAVLARRFAAALAKDHDEFGMPAPRPERQEGQGMRGGQGKAGSHQETAVENRFHAFVRQHRQVFAHRRVGRIAVQQMHRTIGLAAGEGGDIGGEKAADQAAQLRP